jgi:hypothetical protein
MVGSNHYALAFFIQSPDDGFYKRIASIKEIGIASGRNNTVSLNSNLMGEEGRHVIEIVSQ